MTVLCTVLYLLSEEDSTGYVNPAMFSLQVLTLSGPPAARSPHHPDHGLQTLLHLPAVTSATVGLTENK